MKRHHILYSIFLILCVTLIPSCVNMQEDIQLTLFKQVTGVSLDSSSITLTIGSSQTLVATVTPSDATNPAIIWKSSDSSVASVDSNGRVIGNNTGSATITVTTEDGSKTATCIVTVKAATVSVTGVSLDKTSLTLTEGVSETLTATVSPSNATNKNVTWKSSNTSVATVDASGKVTAVKAGTATITVTTEDGGKTASCSVTVKVAVPEAVDLGLSVKWATFNVGASKPEEYGDYFAWGETESKSNYDWSTYKWCNGTYDSLTKYCTYSDLGTVDNSTVLELEDDVAHVKWGGNWRMPTMAEFQELYDNCTWTWTTRNGVEGCMISSKRNDKSIFMPAAGCCIGTNLSMAGTDGRYWYSSLYRTLPTYAYYVGFNSSRDYWDSVGRFHGLSVRPVYADRVNVSSVSLNKSSLSLTEGDTETLVATISPSNATNKNVTWKSSNTSVATVNSTGKVTAVKAGTTTITVTTEEGNKTATCSVTVKTATVSVTGVSLNKSSLSLTEGDSETLVATINPTNATNKNVTWKSSNTSVATVNSTGKVTAVKAGSATITVTTEDGGKTATCSVRVISASSATPEAVDLGLSVKWATFNVGSTRPEEYGDYYAWGETEPKSDYSWSTYKWCNGSSKSMTKYCTDSDWGTVDNKTVLEPEDDVAHVKWGGRWRMPTDAEFTELKENCTWTWTTLNGVNGYNVSSKTTGNSIFLPAAGCRGSSSLGGKAGSVGYYWSSSLHPNGSFSAYYVYFISNCVYMSSSRRDSGPSVRPVLE